MKSRPCLTTLLPLFVALFFASTASGEPAADTPAEQPQLTVAVVAIEAPTGDENIARTAGAAIEAMLSGDPRFEVLNRSQLQQILQEQGLNLSATVDAQEAVQIGKLVGAKLLVTGSVFELGESRMVTAKVISTETSRVKSVLVRDELDEPLDKMVLDAAEQITQVITAEGHQLVADIDEADGRKPLIDEAKQLQLPVIAIVIPEEHRRAAQPQSPPDPAVETELKTMLIAAGAEVRDVQDNALAEWVQQYEAGPNPAWPRTLEGVDLVVVGEAFSESAGTLGDLELASARAEINVISRANGRIVHADRTTTRGVDLAPEIAGKSALERAGRVLGDRLLTHLVRQASAAE